MEDERLLYCCEGCQINFFIDFPIDRINFGGNLSKIRVSCPLCKLKTKVVFRRYVSNLKGVTSFTDCFCVDCIYYQPFNEYRGSCHKNAPYPIVITDPEKVLEVVHWAKFPEVSSRNYCAEWKGK